jgi:ferric-dicitrate binding protein FerR (iron transport regulator)
MTPPRLARRAAKVLAEEELGALTPSNAARSRTVDAVRDALRSRAKQRARRRWLVPLAAAAAAIALGVGLWSSRRPTSTDAASAPSSRDDGVSAERITGALYVLRGGARVPLEAGARVASGEVVSIEGETVFAQRAGTKLVVERGSELAMLADAESQIVRLDRGAVTSHVTKLQAGQRYIVRTMEAEVEVRGTVFRVSRLAEEWCGERTRVVVTEGRVAVRAGKDSVTLEPGGEWSSPCAAPVQPAMPIAAPAEARNAAAPAEARNAAAPAESTPPRPAAPREPAAPAPLVAPASTTALPEASSSAARSDLTVQNALFAEAMSAKSRGEPRRAVSSLDALLERYPRSPLREAAEAQRMNLLVTVDRARARALANEYLTRYPRGFARADAESILRGP